MGYERFSPLPRDIPVVDTVYRVWQPPDLDALIDVAAFERDERIPYWANVWESAIVLAEEVAALDGRGRSFLELGCGIGLPAIVAARRGFAATATDYEDDALEAVRYNAERNGATGLVSRLVDWRNPPDDLRGRMLAGLGVPDLRGGLGTTTFYTARPDVAAGESDPAAVIRGGLAEVPARSRLAEALATARTHKLPAYVSLQPEYSLYKRAGYEAELEALCRKENVGVIGYYSISQ